MKNDTKNLLIDCILLCVLAFCVLLIWFHAGLPIAHGEAGMPFEYPGRWLYHSLFTWWDITATGLPNATPLPYVPFEAAMSALNAFGFSTVLRQAVTFFFLLATSGLSMYGLTRFLIAGEKRRLASLCAGIIYMINPFALYAWHRLHSIIFLLPFLPLISLMFLRGLNEQKNLWRNALFVNAAVFLSSAAFVNPTFLLSCSVLLGILFCFYFLQNRKNRGARLHGRKFITATVLLGLILNLWWLLPLAPTFLFNLESAVAIPPLPTLKILSSNYFQFIFVVRLFESNTYRLLPLNSNPLFLILTFVLPLLAFSALVLEKRRKSVVFFSLLALIGIFLCTGSNPPFGDLFVLLFQVFPFSAGFRNPYDKLGMILMLSYSFLIGVSISSISWKISIKFKRNYHFSKVLSLVLLLLVITPTAISIFSGTVFSPEGSTTGDPEKVAEYYIKIPNSYQNANDWLSKQNGVFRIISFPISPNDFLAYNWESGYFGTAPWNLWNKPIIMSRTWHNEVDQMSTQLSHALAEGDQFWKIMAILNAKYALVQKDYIYWPEFEIQAGYPQNFEYYLATFQGCAVPDYDNSVKLSTYDANRKELGIQQHQITFSSDVPSGDNESIKITSLIEGDLQWEGGIEYVFEPVQNLSQYAFVSYFLKFESLESIGRVYFGIEDVNSNFKKWEITDQVTNSWTRITIPLNSKGLWESMQRLDLSSIKVATFTIEKVQGKMNCTTWWLGSLEGVQTKFRTQVHISESVRFGDLVFFQVEDEFFSPIIYATNQQTSVSDLKTMINDLMTTSIDPRNTTMFLSSQLSEKDLQFINALTLSAKTPKMTFEKVDPTKYYISVENSTGPFFLMFSSTFDKNWVASVDGQPISECYHFKANGYANAWYVDKAGTFTVALEFLPQKLFYVGSAISVTTLLLCVIYLSKNKIKTLYQKYFRKNKTPNNQQ